MKSSVLKEWVDCYQALGIWHSITPWRDRPGKSSATCPGAPASGDSPATAGAGGGAGGVLAGAGSGPWQERHFVSWMAAGALPWACGSWQVTHVRAPLLSV